MSISERPPWRSRMRNAVGAALVGALTPVAPPSAAHPPSVEQAESGSAIAKKLLHELQKASRTDVPINIADVVNKLEEKYAQVMKGDAAKQVIEIVLSDRSLSYNFMTRHTYKTLETWYGDEEAFIRLFTRTHPSTFFIQAAPILLSDQRQLNRPIEQLISDQFASFTMQNPYSFFMFGSKIPSNVLTTVMRRIDSQQLERLRPRLQSALADSPLEYLVHIPRVAYPAIFENEQTAITTLSRLLISKIGTLTKSQTMNLGNTLTDPKKADEVHPEVARAGFATMFSNAIRLFENGTQQRVMFWDDIDRLAHEDDEEKRHDLASSIFSTLPRGLNVESFFVFVLRGNEHARSFWREHGFTMRVNAHLFESIKTEYMLLDVTKGSTRENTNPDLSLSTHQRIASFNQDISSSSHLKKMRTNPYLDRASIARLKTLYPDSMHLILYDSMLADEAVDDPRHELELQARAEKRLAHVTHLFAHRGPMVQAQAFLRTLYLIGSFKPFGETLLRSQERYWRGAFAHGLYMSKTENPIVDRINEQLKRENLFRSMLTLAPQEIFPEGFREPHIFSAYLDRGYLHLLDVLAKRVEVIQKEGRSMTTLDGVSWRIDHLLDQKYPIREIRRLIASGTLEGNMNGDALWRAFGKRFSASTVGDIPNQDTISPALHLFQEDRAPTQYLRTINIQKAEQYQPLFEFLTKYGAHDFEKRLIETADYSAFEMHCRGLLRQQKLHLVADQAMRFSSVTSPLMYRELMRRAISVAGGTQFLLAPLENNVQGDTLHVKDLSGTLRLVHAIMLLDRDSIRTATPRRFVFDDDIATSITSIEAYASLSRIISYFRYLIPERDTEIVWKNFRGHQALTQLIGTLDTILISNLSGFSELARDPLTVDTMRERLNRLNNRSGDEMVLRIAIAYITALQNRPQDDTSLSALLSFARSWGSMGDSLKSSRKGHVHDIAGLYHLPMYFALNIVKSQYEAHRRDGPKLQQSRVEEIQTLLDQRNMLPHDKASLLAKGLNRGSGGIRRATDRLTPPVPITYTHISTTPYAPMPEGTAATLLCNALMCSRENAIALLVDAHPKHVKARLFADRTGIVNMHEIETQLEGSLVAHFVHAFTTGARKLTDFTAVNGEVINFLIKPDSHDGLIIMSKSGVPIIADKKRISRDDLIRLGVSEGDLPESPLSMINISDYVRFVDLIKKYELSVSANILYMKDGVSVPAQNDYLSTRRFHVEFKDGTFALFSSLQPITIDNMVKLAETYAKQHNRPIRSMVYADTGMFDMSSVFDKSGRTHRIGTADGVPTNLIVFSLKK